MDATREYTGTAAITIWAGRFVEAATSPTTVDGDLGRLLSQCRAELGDDSCGRAAAGARGALDAIREAMD